MSFLAPLFLLGGLAIALPVIFHLVRRSSREKQDFSSLMFLKPTPPRMTRRNRLENLFLLLLRCMALGLLALGFARPFLRQPTAAAPTTTAGAQIVILVDTSASMRREGLWPEAMTRVEAELKNTSAADQVAILAFDEQIRPVISFEAWAAMNAPDRQALAAQRLAQQQPTWRGTHLSAALIAAAETIADANKREPHPGPQRIVLVSDLQEGGRLEGLQGHEWPRGLEVNLQTVKARRPTNAGLQWVADQEDTARSSAEPTVRLRVSNSSDARREQFRLQWPGAIADSLDAYVPPGQSRIVPAPKLPPTNGVEQIVLSGDDDDFDNVAYVVQPKAEEVNLLFMGEDAGENPNQSLYYLRRAFQDTRRQQVRLSASAPSRPLPALAPPAARSGGYRLIIIPGALPAERVAEIRPYVTNGGTALVVLDDVAAAKSLGDLLAVPELGVGEATGSKYAMFGQMDFAHPLLAPFTDPRFGDFTKIRFWKHRQLNLDRLPQARVIARFDDNDPAILEIPIGRGRILVFAFSWRPAESQFALSSKFVPLLYALLDQSGAGSPGPVQYRVGDIVELAHHGIPDSAGASSTAGANSPTRSGGDTAAGSPLKVRKPDGAEVQLAAGESRFTQTDQPGVYEATGSGVAFRFAVNLDPAESRTAPLPSDELEHLGVPLRASLATSHNPSPNRVESLRNTELEARQKLWRWLIVAALGVLLVETWLAGRLTRRTTVLTATAT